MLEREIEDIAPALDTLDSDTLEFGARRGHIISALTRRSVSGYDSATCRTRWRLRALPPFAAMVSPSYGFLHLFWLLHTSAISFFSW